MLVSHFLYFFDTKKEKKEKKEKRKEKKNAIYLYYFVTYKKKF